MIVTEDGRPDQNSRYMKTMLCVIDYFLMYDLDAMVIATNAPGCSAFNRVEKRMAPLSKEGTHLDGKGETIDKEVELRNFEYAGSTLAEIWSSLVINGHPTVAEYISKEPEAEATKMSEEWKWVHVRQS